MKVKINNTFKNPRENIFFCFQKGPRCHLPLELDLTLEVLKEDEVLQKNVPPEVAVAELQVHQLEEKQR